MPMRVTEIDWETDGEDVELPSTVIIQEDDLFLMDPEDIDELEYAISEFLSDTYGFLHLGYEWEWI